MTKDEVVLLTQLFTSQKTEITLTIHKFKEHKIAGNDNSSSKIPIVKLFSLK